MPFTYVISNGCMYYPTGEFMETCYSGNGFGLNNPPFQGKKNLGPLPEGWYTFGPLQDHETLGKDVLPLIQDPENQMYGRDGFFDHGDEIANPGLHLASDGCIIQSRLGRLKIDGYGDRRLHVISYPAG